MTDRAGQPLPDHAIPALLAHGPKAPHTLLAPIGLLLAGILGGCGATGTGHFTFQAAEFIPVDQRQAAAQAYLDEHAAPGTPLPIAMAAMRRAGAPCRRWRGRDRVAIRCRYSRPASNSAADLPLGDVTWTVIITPDGSGRVASATLARDTRGL